jgi:hypothetical protein
MRNEKGKMKEGENRRIITIGAARVFQGGCAKKGEKRLLIKY